MRRWIWVVGVAVVTACLLFAIDPPNRATSGDPQAQRALDAVISQNFDRGHPAAEFPADFAAVMGYLPVTAAGPLGKPVLIKSDGDCSGPIGRTGYDFDIVCKQHDLSYDILRYADTIGHPLPAAARIAADHMFQSQLHAQCDSITLAGPGFALCHLMAESYGLICQINGWRQGYGAPKHESPLRWMAIELFTFSVLLGRIHLDVALRWRRRKTLHSFDFQPGWLKSSGPEVRLRQPTPQ